MNIRKAEESDFEAMWQIFKAVVEPGETYVFAPETPREEARSYWFDPRVTPYIAEDEGRIVGMFRLNPNQRDLGSHVANASFMVDPTIQSKGVGKALGLHCLAEAKKAGYLAIQFNFVVSTNEGAVKLWNKLGFSIVGTLPKAFRHARLGLVDVYVMHRFLDDISE